MLTRRTVDPDGAEGKVVEAYMRLLAWCGSRALLGGDGGEGGPALLYFLAATVRADDFALFVVDEGQDPGEQFLAIVAEELVARHGRPPAPVGN